MKLRDLYQSITGDAASETDLTRELGREPRRRRRAVLLRMEELPWRAIGERLGGITGASAVSLVKLTLLSVRKRMLALPRYHTIGHPGPPPEARRRRPAPPPPPRKRGRPPLPRCQCGQYTQQRAALLRHRC